MNDQPRSSTITPGFSGPRTRLAVEDIKQSLIGNLFCGMGRVPAATRNDLHTLLSLIVHDRVFYHGLPTIESLGEQRSRRVAYLSAEYFPRPHVVLDLLNLAITDQMRQAVSKLGYDLDAWRRKSIVQVVRMGKFCSDCSSGEYCEQIWNTKPVDEEVGR
jgi:glucan phosphorylase